MWKHQETEQTYKSCFIFEENFPLEDSTNMYAKRIADDHAIPSQSGGNG